MAISDLIPQNSPAYVDALKMDRAIQLAKEAGMTEDAMALENAAMQAIGFAKNAPDKKSRGEAERNFKSLYGKAVEMQNQVASLNNKQQEQNKNAALIQATANELGSKLQQAQTRGVTLDPKITESITNLLGTGQVEEARRITESILASQPQAEKVAYKKSSADLTFEQNSASAIRYANQLEDTIKQYGTWESSRVGSPEASAKLGQLPYQLAIAYSKVVDPASVVRESEVEAVQKYMVPTGFFASKDKALAAVRNFQNDIKDKVDVYKKSTGADFSIDFKAGKEEEQAKKDQGVNPANEYFKQYNQ